jgi:hypothetical protein
VGLLLALALELLGALVAGATVLVEPQALTRTAPAITANPMDA